MSRKLKIYFTVSLLGIVVFGQDKKEEIFNRRDELKSKIEYTTKLLNAAKIKKEKNIEKVNLLEERIKKRRELINVYNKQIVSIEGEIKYRKSKIIKLKNELKNQKKHYAEIIRYNHKNSSNYNTALFLMASKDMNQFYDRRKYLQQLKEARLKKIYEIGNLEKRIKGEIEMLNTDRELVGVAKKEIEEESEDIEKEIERKNITVKFLEKEEKEFKREIVENRKIIKELSNRLKELIMEESKVVGYAKLTPEQEIISSNFEKNKGRLPWPTRQGIITERFGKHKHPVSPNTYVINNGINISTLNGEKVRSIFSGEVKKVFAIKGANYAVIIRHGEYITLYQNLSNVNVAIGDKIDTKHIIGEASKNSSGSNALVHFEIWKGTNLKELKKLNPEEWISN